MLAAQKNTIFWAISAGIFFLGIDGLISAGRVKACSSVEFLLS
jgi:hypothetical protein